MSHVVCARLGHVSYAWGVSMQAVPVHSAPLVASTLAVDNVATVIFLSAMFLIPGSRTLGPPEMHDDTTEAAPPLATRLLTSSADSPRAGAVDYMAHAMAYAGKLAVRCMCAHCHCLSILHDCCTCSCGLDYE